MPSGERLKFQYKEGQPLSDYTNVVASWRFDENTGSTVADQTGLGHTATIQGNPTWVSGLLGYTDDYCLDLDGTGDYLSVVDAADLSFGNGTTDSPFSIEAWVYIDTLALSAAFSKWTATTAAELREYALFLNADGSLTFNCYDESANTYIGRTTPIVISTGVLYHVMCTYSGSSTSAGCKIYVNGMRMDNANSESGVYVAMENLSTAPMIGAFTSTASVVSMNGKIDQTSIFSYELTSTQVQDRFQAGLQQSRNVLAQTSLQLLDKVTIVSAVTVYPFACVLDGDNDGGYLIKAYIVNGSSSRGGFGICLNTILVTGEQMSMSRVQQTGASTITGSYAASGAGILTLRGSANADNKGSMEIYMPFSKSGVERVTHQIASKDANDANLVGIYTQEGLLVTTTSGTNITCCAITSQNNASGIGIGSILEIYRIRNFT